MKTWEEAAQAAASAIMLAITDETPLQEEVDLLRAEGSAWLSGEWASFGAKALEATDQYELDGITAVVISKQKDYGPANILQYGVQGVCVRISDKWARIENLERKGAAPENESLIDSYLDLVGYSMIGYMLCEGTFELPLAEDLKPALDLPAKDATGIYIKDVSIDLVEFVQAEIARALEVYQTYQDDCGWTQEKRDKVLRYEKVMLDVQDRVDLQIKMALDAHLAAFHPSTIPPNSGIYVGDVPPYNPNQGIFPWGWPQTETRSDTR